MRNRGGMTLIEVVSMMALIGTLLSTSAIVINQSFNTHRAALDHLRRMHSLEQFVERWRSDVHASKQVAVSEKLELTLNDLRQFHYTTKENVVTRVQYMGETAVGQETWELPNSCQLSWELVDEGTHKLLIGELMFNNSGDLAHSLELDPIELVARVGIEYGTLQVANGDTKDASATNLKEANK